MPARRRAQEFKRKLRKAVAETEQEIERAERQVRLLSVSTDPLSDECWDEHENPEKYLCSCYADTKTEAILADARREIEEYKRGQRDRAGRG